MWSVGIRDCLGWAWFCRDIWLLTLTTTKTSRQSKIRDRRNHQETSSSYRAHRRRPRYPSLWSWKSSEFSLENWVNLLEKNVFFKNIFEKPWKVLSNRKTGREYRHRLSRAHRHAARSTPPPKSHAPLRTAPLLLIPDFLSKIWVYVSFRNLF